LHMAADDLDDVGTGKQVLDEGGRDHVTSLTKAPCKTPP
jgi:hypothetical protein